MTATAWVPDAGDIVWLHFSLLAGHEPAVRRPALVLSPAAYNDRTSLMLCCPLTTRIKGYPFEVAVPGEPPSVVLADQVRSLGWRGRQAEAKWRVGEDVVREMRARVLGLVS